MKALRLRVADFTVADEVGADEVSVAGCRESMDGTLELSWMPKLARLPLELSDEGTGPELATLATPAVLPALPVLPDRTDGAAGILNSAFCMAEF